MALSDAKRASDKRHSDKLDQIMIRPYKSEGAEIRAAATKAGQSVQAYVLQAVRERMVRDPNDNSLDEAAIFDHEGAHEDAGAASSADSSRILFRWDYGMNPEQREKKMKSDSRRFVELSKIHRGRDFSEKEYLEFINLVLTHQNDVLDEE